MSNWIDTTAPNTQRERLRSGVEGFTLETSVSRDQGYPLWVIKEWTPEGIRMKCFISSKPIEIPHKSPFYHFVQV